MIKLYCDICGAEKENHQILGVNYARKDYISLTSAGYPFINIGGCSKHICKDCLEKLGWIEKEAEEVTK
jgi:hypothetical protein